MFVVLASQRFATERALQEYTHELLRNVVDETRENAVAYLEQAEDSVALAGAIIENGLVSVEHPDELDRLFLQQLKVIPQIDAAFFGDRGGRFIFSKRMPDDAGFMSKFIRIDDDGGRRVDIVHRDAGLQPTDASRNVEDGYDPRERPWFQLASAHDATVWTDPYIFYTAQQPGLTAARAVRGPDGEVLGVIGSDIELSALSAFLKTQRIGRSGAAFIVYRNGDVLAHPDATPLALQDADGGLRLRKLAEIDPVAEIASARLQARGEDLAELGEAHYDRFVLQDQGYLSMFVPLLTRGENSWFMGVYAPEDELARKIREGQRESIFLGVAVSLLVVTAAILIGVIALRPLFTLQRHAREDPLTGLLNRRSFSDQAARRLAFVDRNGQAVSALMIDIDRFKPINDQHGHTVGDEVIQAVSRRLTRGLSNADLLSRFGGEEFAVLLPGTDLAQAADVAERLRNIVGKAPIKTSAGELKVTVSLGVAQRATADEGIASLLHRADQNLLEAKRRGRDRVVADG